MKRLSKLIYLTLAPVLFACSDGDAPYTPPRPVDQSTPLAAPANLTSQAGSNTVSFSWSAVENAKCYAYRFNGGDETYTEATGVDFDGLTPQTVYPFRVKAVSGDLKQWTDSEWVEVEVTTQAVDVPDLKITVDEVTFYSIGVTVEPADASMTYFCNLISKADFDKIGEQNMVEAQIGRIAALAAQNEMTFEAYCLAVQLLQSGKKSFESASPLEPDTEYVEYAFGLTTAGEPTTSLFSETVRTKKEPSVTHSDMTLALEVIDCSDIGATMRITPSKDDEFYFCYFVNKDNLDRMGDDQVIGTCIDDLNEYISSSDYQTEVTAQCHKGPYTYTYAELEPNQEYVGFAFGIGKHGLFAAATTRLFKTEPFMTKDTQLGDDPIRIEIIRVGITDTQVKFIPMPEAIPFRCEMKKLSEFADLSDQQILEKDMEQVWKELGDYYVWSLCTEEFTLTRVNPLEPDTDYIAYAYGLSDSKFEATTGLCKKILRTPSAVPAGLRTRTLAVR